ncbi:unnamed protein product [Durusdinium trenchii]|uniref:Uncharacterized protein n=1 Tax=Durusdinium trenchii TaxID=1381693 RepID=A0ABP0RWF3_9DINO
MFRVRPAAACSCSWLVPLTPLQLLRQRSSRPTSAAPREEPSLSEFGEVNLSTVGSRLSRPSSAAQLRLGAQQAPPVPAVALPLTMTFGRPASAGAVRAGDQRGQGQIAVSPETGAEDQGRPTSAPSVHSSVASGSAASVATSQVPMEAARPFQVHDAVEPPSGAKNCTAEVSQSSLSTQQPLHSETSQELDVPEEDCDDATEAELQKRVEELRRQAAVSPPDSQPGRTALLEEEVTRFWPVDDRIAALRPGCCAQRPEGYGCEVSEKKHSCWLT